MSKVKTITDDHPLAVENPLARLLQIGRDKGYVTLDDIADIYPKAENNVDQLEEAFSALLTADIPYVESKEEVEELFEEEEEDDLDDLDELEDHTDRLFDEIDPLENISTNDTVGLYIKQAGKVPLDARRRTEINQPDRSGQKSPKSAGGRRVDPGRKGEPECDCR